MPCPKYAFFHNKRVSLYMYMGVAHLSCLGDGGEGWESNYSWVLLASATSEFSGYIKLAYCSSAKGLQ